MRALLTPIVVAELGLVMFRPGTSLLMHFRRGRMLLATAPERLAGMPNGELPPAEQPLAEDPALAGVFENDAVLRRAGGIGGLESWLMESGECQWPHESWHAEHITTMRHAPGALRLCWHCDNQLREQTTEQLAHMARANCAAYILTTARRELGSTIRIRLRCPSSAGGSRVMAWPMLCRKMPHVRCYVCRSR